MTHTSRDGGPSPTRVRLGEYLFDPASGELRRAAPGAGWEESPEAERLPPQPAHLLTLLIEKRGELLSREAIREQLWPGVEVDFDKSLHFCVRQVRSALGDSASAPRYVETLPRRGYRLMVPAEPLVAGGASSAAPDEGAIPAAPIVPASPRAPAPRPFVLFGLPWLLPTLATTLLLATLAIWGLATHSTPPPPPRIAVMAFTPPSDLPLTGLSGVEATERIGEEILVRLTQAAGARAQILGPRTTGAYDSSPASLQRMADDHDLDYFINPRFLPDEPTPRMLIELIRASDGAHIWVESFADLTPWQEIAAMAVEGTVGTLDLEGE